MKRKIEIKASNDGSHTLYLPELDETYHSIHGAINESNHVFLKMGFDTIPNNEINILEVGFGTGLNAFLTALHAEKQQKKTFYYTLEPFPIDESIYSQLNYAQQINPKEVALFTTLHQLPWEKKQYVSDHFSFFKSTSLLQNISFNNEFDLIYFDAFAPNKQAELWETEVLKNCYHALKPQGILVTYCSQGQFKRNLKAAGFKVEKLVGPPGKREMTRGTKPLPPV